MKGFLILLIYITLKIGDAYSLYLIIYFYVVFIMIMYYEFLHVDYVFI